MRVQLSLSWLLGVLAITLASSISAQTPPPPDAATPAVSTRATDLLIPARAGGGYNTSGGGYEGFGSFEGLIPLKQNPGQDLLYLVGRFLLDNDANPGGNLLVGYRFYNPGSNLIYGGYLGYDSRSTGANVFSQFGLGFEALADGWDARINGYIPVGNTIKTVSESLFTTGTQLNSFGFAGNFIQASGTRQQQLIRNVEVAMAGFDGEAGGRLLKFGNGGDLRGYAGLYYLSGGGENSFGVRGRLAARPLEHLTLGVAVQHDSIFGTNVVGTIALTFPSGRPRGVSAPSVLARMGEMPYRVNAIAIDQRTEVEFTSTSFTDAILTNPVTGQPYFFQHVVLGTTGGNGTFESPFGVVQSALNATRSDGNEIVYVQTGTNPGIPAFTIPARVQVLSTGPIQEVPATIAGQFFPAYQLPLSGSGVRPNVNGTVTMRSDTVLSGFDITSATGAGITFNNVTRVEIRDNVIRNTASAGILGNGVAIANLSRNQVIAAQDQGIYLQNVGAATVTDNNVANTRAGSGVISNPISGDISIGSITIPNPGSIIPLPSGQGIVIATTTGDIKLTRNTILETGTQGIVVLNARGNVEITDSRVTNTVGANFPVTIPGFGSFQVPTGQGIVVSGVSGNVDVSRNTVNAVNGQGIAIAGTTNGTTTIDNNTVRNVADQGLVLAGTSGTTNITNNQISDISARPVTLTVPILGAVTIATGQGMALINSIDTVNITGNTIERARDVLPLSTFPGGQGIQVANFSGQVNLNIANNQVRNNDNDGILMGFAGTTGGTTPPATANITIRNNTIENNGGAVPVRGDGIAIGLEQAATINNLLIENNVIRNNGDEGIDIRLGLQAILVVNPTSAQLTGTIQNNNISSNGQNGVQVSVRGGSTATVAIDNNTLANNGFRAVDLGTASLIGLGSPNLSTNVRGNTITQGANPVVQAVTTTSLGAAQTQCLNLTGNTFTVPSPTVQLNNPANFPANTFSVVGGVFNIGGANTFSGVFATNFPPGIASYTTVAACP